MITTPFSSRLRLQSSAPAAAGNEIGAVLSKLQDPEHGEAMLAALLGSEVQLTPDIVTAALAGPARSRLLKEASADKLPLESILQLFGQPDLAQDRQLKLAQVMTAQPEARLLEPLAHYLVTKPSWDVWETVLGKASGVKRLLDEISRSPDLDANPDAALLLRLHRAAASLSLEDRPGLERLAQSASEKTSISLVRKVAESESPHARELVPVVLPPVLSDYGTARDLLQDPGPCAEEIFHFALTSSKSGNYGPGNAWEALGKHSLAKDVRFLSRMARDPAFGRLAHAIAQRLLEVRAGKEDLPILESLLDEPTCPGLIRGAALTVLSRAGELDPLALRQALVSSAMDVCCAAIGASGRADDPTFRAACTKLGALQLESYVLTMTARALSQDTLSGPLAVSRLGALLQSKRAEVRQSACFFVQHLPKGSLGGLRALLGAGVLPTDARSYVQIEVMRRERDRDRPVKT